ncbi:MAG: BMP family ABC transporter substrate-binding protein [Anaerolineae bacterium]|nr:BMP family ABC transporter substrate-binding protein [Anaerolineae bacterium]
MKRFAWLTLLLVLALVLVACGGSKPPAEAPKPTAETAAPAEETTQEEAAPPAKEGPFRVAVVMPSAINDLAFSQSMFETLTKIQNELGPDNFQFAYSDNMFVVDDAATAMRDYASQGYDLILGHGSQYGGSLQEIAPDFPNTSFAWGTTVDTFGIPNIYAYEARSEEGGYVNGVTAALMSKSGMLGVIGPIETGDAKLYVDGFVAGAKATNPDIVVNVNYIGSFSDTALAAEAASTQVGAGADALTGSAQMVAGAIGVAESKNVPWFGTQSSQTALAPSVVVASQVYDWENVVKTIMENVKAGKLGGTSFELTLANGGLVMDYNPAYDLPADVRAAADAAAAGIASGAISVFGGPTTAPAEGTTGEVAPITFGMILVGPKNDHGWSQANYEGGQYVLEKIPGSQLIVFESLNPADKPGATLEGVVDDMVAQGATLIFTTSDEFQEDTRGAALKYPDVTFMMVSGDDVITGKASDNLGNVMGRMEYMKSVSGCAAALTTETGKIGYLGPLTNDETRRLVSSAYLGAKYCWENYRGEDPKNLTFAVSWIGFWFNIPGVTLDPTEVVSNFIDTGTDVVLSGIDTTEAIDVTGQRAERGDKVWGIPYDFIGACNAAPEACLGVPFFNWGPQYLRVATEVSTGTWKQSWVWADPYWDDLTNLDKTNVGWVDGPALSEEHAADLHKFIEGMASGEINVWTGPINLQDGTPYIEAGKVATDDQIWFLEQLLEGMTGASK